MQPPATGKVHFLFPKMQPRSSGHQEMRHLLLSPDAKAFSLPSLEIETDDVRCGHAATMSAPDPEQLFFLRSRGLSEPAAISLIAQGFSHNLFEKIRALGIDFPVPETTHSKKRMRHFLKNEPERTRKRAFSDALCF
jgi:hypothetical protein